MAQNKIKKKYIVSKKIDFLDFGASKTASLEYGKNHFQGQNGLGVDLDEQRVAKMKAEGYECVVGDLTKVSVPRNSVRFVKMAHILEHLPDLKSVERVIDIASNAATDFLVITGPFFDKDEYLRSHHLKLHWSDYPDHPCHLKVSQLVKILEKLGLNKYEVYLRYPILDSSNEHVHPLSSPSHSHQYDPSVHPPKKMIKFDQLIWTDFVCYVKMRDPVKDWETITLGYHDQIPFRLREGARVYEMPEHEMLRYALLRVENQQLKQKNITLLEKNKVLNKKLTGIYNSTTWKIAKSLISASSTVKRKKR